MRILVVHEVNYLSKIIYEFQIIPEILSILGHDVTVVDYDDTWRHDPQNRGTSLSTHFYRNVHRAYPQASVTVRRPGMIRVPILSRISGALAATCEIRRVIKSARPDIILLYGIPTIGVQTLFLARKAGIPVVCRAIDVTHELVPNKLLVPATHVLAKYVFSHASLNIALTPHLKKYIESYGVESRRIQLLPSGVDTGMFSPGERKPEVLERWGIHTDDRVILFMGTIYRFSGLDTVIRNFSQLVGGHRPPLQKNHSTTKLLIAGSGEDELRLKRLAADCGIAGNVVFTGLLSYAALPDLIRACDVCINPFELNGITEKILPTKLFQYLACGKPVVATELPGTITFLNGEQQGVVYARLDDLVSELSRLLSDRERMNRLGQNGVRAVADYDWRQIAQTMIEWMKVAA